MERFGRGEGDLDCVTKHQVGEGRGLEAAIYALQQGKINVRVL